MNKLDMIDMKLEYKGDLNAIFQEMGRMDVTQEIKDETTSSAQDVEMKATTIRLPVNLLEGYDAVLRYFELSRQDTFTYMVHDFIAGSIINYLKGRFNTYANLGVKFFEENGMATDNYDNAFKNEYEQLLDALTDDLEVKNYIRLVIGDRYAELFGGNQ